jgi:hypothetical protein
MIQKTLSFDTPEKLSRKSDKLTSQKSAAETEPKLKGCKAKMLAVMQTSQQPLTANEAADGCHSIWPDTLPETYRKRALDLVRDGFITECGERKCQVTGKTATTYKLKEQR